jgi:hypothetical protein
MTLGIGGGSFVTLAALNCPNAIAIRYAASLIGSGAVYLSNPGTIDRRAKLVAQIKHLARGARAPHIDGGWCRVITTP